MIKLYQFIFILACASFLCSCQEEQVITTQQKQSEIEVGVDPESLKEQSNKNERTSAAMVNLYRVRVWLNRDQWAGGTFRIQVVEQESGDQVTKSGQVAVTQLTTNSESSTRVSFVIGGSGIPIEKGVKYKIKLLFSQPHDDVGYVYSWASTTNIYVPGCGPSCDYDLTFQTYNITNGLEWVDEDQTLKRQRVSVNGYTSVGQEFVSE